MNPLLFNSSFGLKLSVSQVVDEVIRFMKTEPERRYCITIGSDSEVLSSGRADFVTAIVIHRIGNGGRYFWRRFQFGKFHTLRDRVIEEVLASLEVAEKTLNELKKFPGMVFDFEIHVDIGEGGPTKSLIQEVVAMIRAYNFKVKTKPESYAASNVADRHV